MQDLGQLIHCLFEEKSLILKFVETYALFWHTLHRTFALVK